MVRIIGVLEEMGRTGAEEVSVEWKIPNFPSLLDGRDGNRYDSPTFRFCNGSWYLGIIPNWSREAGNPASGWMWLALIRCDVRPPATVRFSVGIRGSGGVEKSREGEKKFGFLHRSYSWYDFCSRSDLLEHRTRLMPDDTLIIRCVLKRAGAARGVCSSLLSTQVAPTNRIPSSDNQGVCSSLPSTQVAPTNRIQSSDKQDACTQTDCDLDAEVFSGEKKSTEKRGGEKALEDFAKFLTSGERSDVTVQVGDVEFKVHSFVLFARCPALSVSLQHASKERESGRIVIEDCEPDVFRGFLHHLYTGSVPSLTEHNAFGLYRVADRYLVDDLKERCVEHIQGTLSVLTFCDSMKLALSHREGGLLQLAIDFATRNIRSIVSSVEWQNFLREYPTEANEIFIKSLGPPSGKKRKS